METDGLRALEQMVRDACAFRGRSCGAYKIGWTKAMKEMG